MNPVSKLGAIAEIADIDEKKGNIKPGYEGKFFPLPDAPPAELGTTEDEQRARLRENRRYFGQMMIGGAWGEDGDAWVDVLIRAWSDSNFLQRLRDNPKRTIETEYPDLSARINVSPGKFFPISKEPPEQLKGLSEDELRTKLNESTTTYMGWMRTCCR